MGAAMLTKGSFILAAAILIAGALLHILVLIGGAEWIAFVGAPEVIVQSAERGTWLAPASTLAVAALLGILAVYALSASGALPPLPFVRSVLALFAAIFVLRGLIVAPALLQGRVNWSAPVDLFIIASSAAILMMGIALCLGLWGLRRAKVRARTLA
jgi:hypothetical protein